MAMAFNSIKSADALSRLGNNLMTSPRWFEVATIGIVKRLLILTLLSSACLAADYYVSPSGNDANNGSQGSPWQTLAHANDTFVLGATGTTIHVLAGTYS